MSYPFSKSDIPYKTAYEAHRGTSFSPERRAKGDQESYFEDLKNAYEELHALAVKWDVVEKFEKRFGYFVDGYKKRYLDYLYSQHGWVSTMIAGPSNFPAARMNKKGDRVHKKLNELLSYYNLQLKKIKNYLKPAHLKPVKTGQDGAIDILQKQLDDRLATQEAMKAVNKIAKSKTLSPEKKIEKLKTDLKLSDKQIVEIMTPDYAGRIGYPGYLLTNNNANIKRLKGRISEEKKLAVQKDQGNKEHKFDGGLVIENFEQNRLQIKHDEKPPREIIQKLKARGFRWSPYYGVWQRNLNTTPMFYATNIVGELTPIAQETTAPENGEEVELSEEEQKSIEDQVKERMKEIELEAKPNNNDKSATQLIDEALESVPEKPAKKITPQPEPEGEYFQAKGKAYVIRLEYPNAPTDWGKFKIYEWESFNKNPDIKDSATDFDGMWMEVKNPKALEEIYILYRHLESESKEPAIPLIDAGIKIAVHLHQKIKRNFDHYRVSINVKKYFIRIEPEGNRSELPKVIFEFFEKAFKTPKGYFEKVIFTTGYLWLKNDADIQQVLSFIEKGPLEKPATLAEEAKIVRAFIKKKWPTSAKKIKVLSKVDKNLSARTHVLIDSGNNPLDYKLKDWFFKALGEPKEPNNVVKAYGIVLYRPELSVIVKAIHKEDEVQKPQEDHKALELIKDYAEKAEAFLKTEFPKSTKTMKVYRPFGRNWVGIEFEENRPKDIEQFFLQALDKKLITELELYHTFPDDKSKILIHGNEWPEVFDYIKKKDISRTSPPEEEKENCARKFYINKIHTDPARFQNREKLNQEIINEIAENFDSNQFDPVVIWYDKKAEKWFLLAGHHRLKGAEKSGRKMVKTRCFEGTEAEAIKYAKELSNANRTLETPMERAKIYRAQIGNTDKKELEQKAKRLEGKNWNYILNLAYLKPTGKVVTALTALDRNSDKVTQQNLEKIADWTGEARRLFPRLTDAHEDEIYDFLLSNFAKTKSISRKTDWITKINAMVHRLDFDPDEPLNLKRIAYKTQGESEYETQMFAIDEEIKAVEKSKQALKDRFNDPKVPGYVHPDLPSYQQMQKEAEQISEKLDQKLKTLRKKKLDLMQKKGRMIKGGLDQGNLFAQVIKKVDAKVIEIRKEQNKPTGASYDLLQKEIHILFRKKTDEPDGFLFVRQNLKYIKNILEIAKKDQVQFTSSDVIKLGVIIQPILQGDQAIQNDVGRSNKRTLAPTFNNLLRWTGNPGRYDLIGVDTFKNEKPTILARKVKKARIFNLLGIK